MKAGGQILQDFAYATPERNRLAGGPAHNATVNYLYDTLAALGDYYDVQFEPFVFLYSAGNASFAANGVDQSASLMTYSPGGDVTEELVPVANFGCEAVSNTSSLCQSRI